MAAVLRLLVVVRIEVDVVDYHRVCSCEVDAQTARLRREDEQEYALVLREFVYELLSAKKLRGEVQVFGGSFKSAFIINGKSKRLDT